MNRRDVVIHIIVILMLILGMLVPFLNGVAAKEKNVSGVIFIESPGCTKCAAAEKTLAKINLQTPLNVTSYFYYSDDGHRIIKDYRAKDVPAIIIGTNVINYRDYDGDNAKMERLVLEALANQSPDLSPILALPSNDSRAKIINGNGLGLNLEEISIYAISAVLGAGLVAGFNPCLLGILVFLSASVLSSSGKRRELAMMVLFFSLGIFAMYFLFGLGMQRLLQTEAVADSFRYILTVFLLVAGLSQILDSVRLSHGKASLFRTDWALKYFQAGVDKERLGSYFLIGALFSLVKAPCVGAIYLAILDLLSARNYFEGAAYLFFFNLGVVLPIVILGGFIALGMSPDQVDVFRKDHRVGLRLFTGLTLLALAPLIYWQII